MANTFKNEVFSGANTTASTDAVNPPEESRIGRLNSVANVGVAACDSRAGRSIRASGRLLDRRPSPFQKRR